MQLSKSLRLMRLGALALVAGAVVGLPAGASFAAGDV